MLLAAATQVNNKTYSFDPVLKSDFLNVLIVCSGMERKKDLCVCADSHIFLEGKIISEVGITLLPFFQYFQEKI